MKYVITGSTGNISKPLATTLTSAGHDVTVISSNESKKSEIESVGAKPAIGNILDVDFLTQIFSGADAVYVMIPPNFVVTDWRGYQHQAADTYVAAIEKTGIKNVVQLSSIGAHMGNGAGPIDGLAYFEKKLDDLQNVNVKKLRPSYFFTNFYTMVDLIKNAEILGSNMGTANQKIVLTHPNDIAAAAAKYLLDLDFTGQSISYVSSDIRSFSEIAAALGNAIGKPNLPWVSFTDEEALQGMLGADVPEALAKDYQQMGKSIREGRIEADYHQRNEYPHGKVKLEDFAKEFALAFRN